ncbi:MAG: Ldh family oxidoreductase [Victivallaceae bacterium]|nr:Ldh family oxidoreductase [Victivallaceae bacterium]
MAENIYRVSFDKLEAFMRDVFVGLGVPAADAAVCAEVLITADKRGIDSHGIGRLKPIYYDRIRLGIQNPVTNFEIVREGPTTAVIDGHNGMGQVIARRAMQLAIDKAAEYGLGMTAVRNSTHYGIAGYYALMAAENEMIGITGSNARPSIAPTFGVENMLGTNPLTFAIPSDEEFPFCLDCATSVSQRGKLEVYDRAGEAIPPGWVIGRDGRSRTDTHQILRDLVNGTAALAPLGGIGETGGGYKGYGYATVVEILSAALQQGAFLKGLLGYDPDGSRRPYRLGHFFMAIDVGAFVEPAEFKKTTGDILRALRHSQTAPGCDRIYTAGEKEYLAGLERREKGVPVNPPLRQHILEMKAELGLNQYHFDFED